MRHEMRRHPRARVQLAVYDERQGAFWQTRDISHEGMFVCGPPLEVGTRLALNVHFPACSVPLRVAAEVVRVEAGPETGMGLKLLHSTEPQRLYFQGQVDRLLKA